MNVRSATLVHPITKEVIKIKHSRDFWEDEYDSNYTDHLVKYYMYNQTGKLIKTEIVTPSRVILDSEAIMYYFNAIKALETLGYLQVPELIKVNPIDVKDCYPL